HPRVGVAVLAQRGQSFFAWTARATGDRERHDDAVADLEVLHLATDLDDFAHELVPEDVALLERRDVAVVEVEVRSTDRGARDLHDGIAGIEDLRIGDPLDVDLLRSVPTKGFHGIDSCRSSWVSEGRSTGRAACMPRWMLASECTTSPVSMTCFRRRRSPRICIVGSSPNSFANATPSLPPGA